MDAGGKTLLRVSQRPAKSAVNGSSTRNIPLKRIDIGGVTFVQKSTNVLVRTNTHNTRSLLRYVLLLGQIEFELSVVDEICL